MKDWNVWVKLAIGLALLLIMREQWPAVGTALIALVVIALLLKLVRK